MYCIGRPVRNVPPVCRPASMCREFRTQPAARRRVAKRASHLTRRATSPWATEEQYDLFRDYLDGRHAAGGMADMDVFEFAAMVEETPIRSRLFEYSEGPTLTAVCLTDILDDGLSMVYSFFDPDLRSYHSVHT